MTQDPSLLTLRQYASSAIVSFSRVGRLFTNSMLFHDEELSFFGHLALDGCSILDTLLQYHFDILLSIYIRAIYTQPRIISDEYFESVIQAFDLGDRSCILSYSGQILVLGLVGIQRDHPHARLLIEKLLLVIDETTEIERIREESTTALRLLLVQKFSYLTEAVFSTVFTLLQMRELRLPINELIDVVRPWTSVLRQLPKQTVCAQDLPVQFQFFTPYQFLFDLMTTTEAIDDEQFRSIASLWIQLMKSRS
jgi:hypothetical protein